MTFLTTGDAKIRSTRCYILFDSKDGNIHHVHHVVTMEGAQETLEKDAEARTLRFAKERGLDARRMRLVQVDSEALAAPGYYKVDPKTLKIVKHLVDAKRDFRKSRSVITKKRKRP